MLFRKFARAVTGIEPSARYIAVDIIEMDDDWILDSSAIHLRINFRKLPPLYFRCETEGLELGFIHSHPLGVTNFSGKDDINEQNILKGYSGSNGNNVSLISLILSGSQLRARVRHARNPTSSSPIRHVAILDKNVDVFLGREMTGDSGVLLRQEAAFGKPFNRKLQSLRVVIVGAGGTGSAVACLLARAGVGEVIIIDGDRLEESNLNRVRGYRKADVGKNKALTLATYIKSLDLPVSVLGVDAYVDRSAEAVDAVSSADIIFGCTDDVAGRDTLNQAMYYYSLAYIDVGLTGKIDIDEDGYPYLRDHRARISTILPEFGACLRCQRIVTQEKLAYERALRERPELAQLDSKTLREEYYLIGGGEQAPGVGPFTSATGDLAVATLMNLIKPYRKLPSDLRQDNIWQDFVNMVIHSNTPLANDTCFCCGPNGLLLAHEREYRLDMPQLGKIFKYA
ncbi:MAG: ThiF family adenylyltransferase [Gammaproteobacteria bacterium]|nr:ThiF family adenylyltransferase [Gammaproteobacteria bacterium]